MLGPRFKNAAPALQEEETAGRIDFHTRTSASSAGVGDVCALSELTAVASEIEAANSLEIQYLTLKIALLRYSRQRSNANAAEGTDFTIRCQYGSSRRVDRLG